MEIAFHLGAHCTDENQLLRSLLDDKGRLADQGICVPGPGRYRDVIVKAAQKLRGQVASEDSQQDLLGAMIDDDSTGRVVMSFENFICVPGRVFDGGEFYGKAAFKPTWLRNLFSCHQVEFFMAIRNPATFLPALLAHRDQTHGDLPTALQGAGPMSLRWSDVVAAIQTANPDTPLTIWCNEDTPLIWPEIMREITALEANVELRSGLRIVAKIIEKEGLQRLRNYLRRRTPQTEIQRRRIVTAYLDKYAIEAVVEEEIDLPGWSAALVEDLTQTYEDDLQVIARMPGVNFLSP